METTKKRRNRMNFDNQSIKRMIRSGYFGDRTTFTTTDIRKHAAEVEVPVTYFVECMHAVDEEIRQERKEFNRR